MRAFGKLEYFSLMAECFILSDFFFSGAREFAVLRFGRSENPDVEFSSIFPI